MRNPKPEIRRPKEARNPKHAFGLRSSDFFRISAFGFRISILLLFFATISPATASDTAFQQGISAYRASDYSRATKAFGDLAVIHPASGTLQNLGNSEWQQGHTGRAILAWEKAIWLDPFNHAARADLRFARRVAQIQSPDLTWYEVVSSWLPPNWWAWIAGLSLWSAVAMMTLPDIFRRPRAAWHQAVAALGLMVFLLSLPAHLGVYTRSRLGYVVQKDTPLRLTPTYEAQTLTRLAAGEPARCEGARGAFILIRTTEGHRGWIEREQLGFIFSVRKAKPRP